MLADDVAEVVPQRCRRIVPEAVDLDEDGARDPRSELSAVIDREHGVGRSVHDERRHLDVAEPLDPRR